MKAFRRMMILALVTGAGACGGMNELDGSLKISELSPSQQVDLCEEYRLLLDRSNDSLVSLNGEYECSLVAAYAAQTGKDCLADWETCLLDLDQDGTPNQSDSCPRDPLKTEPGICGCGRQEMSPCSSSVSMGGMGCEMEVSLYQLATCHLTVAEYRQCFEDNEASYQDLQTDLDNFQCGEVPPSFYDPPACDLVKDLCPELPTPLAI